MSVTGWSVGLPVVLDLSTSDWSANGLVYWCVGLLHAVLHTVGLLV